MSALAASNSRIRRLRRLSRRRSARFDDGAFLVEGPVLVGEALASSHLVEALFVEPDGATDPVVERAKRAGVEVHAVERGVLAGITDTVTPRPLLAVVRLPNASVDHLIKRAIETGRPLVVLVDVRDPGNVGTILRAAEASGVAGVVCTKGTADPWAPKTVRSSAGAIFHVPLAVGSEPEAVLGQIAARNLPRVGTVVRGGISYDEADLHQPVAIILGNEAHGLAAEHHKSIDQPVSIPMEGRSESLNVAMAAAILCFEAQRQRRRQPGPLSASQQIDWTARLPDDKVTEP